MSVGIPIKLFYEGIGHVITAEIKTGEVYRGILANVEDNMNCLLEEVTATQRDGKKSALEQLYIRGSQIRFVIFPDMLRYAPMFRTIKGLKEKGGGFGLSAPRKTMAMRTRAGVALGLARRGGGRGGTAGGAPVLAGNASGGAGITSKAAAK